LNKSLLLFGACLGIAGALLDFYSGSSFLSMSMSSTTMMGVTTTHYNAAAQAWGTFLVILGIVLALTAVLSITSLGMMRMPLFGALMMGYGVVMLSIGGLMFSGFTPMMQDQTSTLISSFGMFGVGALMLVNGSVMVTRARTTPTSREVEM